jgi:hypothetical protein
MQDVGRWLVGMGLLLAATGTVILVATRSGLPLGRLPGDFSYKGKNATFYFPLGTSIAISVILSMIVYIISRFRR